jgi:hypothetical protein
VTNLKLIYLSIATNFATDLKSRVVNSVSISVSNDLLLFIIIKTKMKLKVLQPRIREPAGSL